MRRVLVLALALFLAPATAHEGSAVPDLFPVEGTVTTDDPLHNFPVSWPVGTQTIGDRMTWTVVNDGPGDLEGELRLDGEPVNSWTAKGNGKPNWFVHPIQATGDYSFHLTNPSSTDEPRVGFLWDAGVHCNVDPLGCTTKFLPWEVPHAAAVFRFDVDVAGMYRTTIANNELHNLRVAVYGPDGLTSLGSESAENSNGEIRLGWTTESTGTHHIVVTSDSVDDTVFFNALKTGGGAAARETMRVTVLTDGPISTGIPGPGAPLLALGVLAVAVLARRTQ